MPVYQHQKSGLWYIVRGLKEIRYWTFNVDGGPRWTTRRIFASAFGSRRQAEKAFGLGELKLYKRVGEL